MAITFDNTPNNIFAFPDGSNNIPYSVFAADIDGDGDVDVFSASYGYSGSTSSVAFHENLGDGTFADPVTLSQSDGATAVKGIDIDGDGTLDGVVYAAQTDNTVGFNLFDDASGVFLPQQTISSDVSGVRDVIATDVDGDGFDDVVTAALASDSVVWFRNNGDGTIATTPNVIVDTSSADIIDASFNPNSLFAADLDGQNGIDIVVSSNDLLGDGVVAALLNNGDGTFDTNNISVISTNPVNPTSVSGGDFDGDGDVDVVVASSGSDEVIVYANNGDGTFATGGILNTASGETAYSVYAADLDGDGDLDIAAASFGDGATTGDVSVFENLGNGSFSQESVVADVVGANFVFAADIDGDELLELLVSSYTNQDFVYFENTSAEVEFAAANYTADETDGSIDIILTRTGDLGNTSTVSLGIADGGSATFNNDFSVTGSNPVTFGAGEDSLTVTVDIIDDTEVEGVEDVTFTLSSSDTVIGDQSTTVLAIDDANEVPIVEFSSASFEVAEDGVSVDVIVNRTGNLSGTSEFNLAIESGGTATSGDDFTVDLSSPFTFAANEDTLTVTVDITDDDVEEATEDVTFTLTSTDASVGTQGSTVLNITDNDLIDDSNDTTEVEFSAASFSTSEDETSVDVTITRTGDLSVTSEVTLAIAGGSATSGDDFTVDLTPFTFAANEDTRTVTVNITDDDVEEGAEDVTFTLSSTDTNLGTQVSTVVDIADNDVTVPEIAFADSSFSVNEGDGTGEITLTRTGDDLTNPSVVTVDVTGGDATGGSDYVDNFPVSVTFAANETTQTVNVTITDDTQEESTEQITLSLTGDDSVFIGTQGTTSLSITDNDSAAPITFDDSDPDEPSFILGGNEAVNLKVTLNSVEATNVNQIIAYTIEDGQTINDILQNGQIVFSSHNDRSAGEINFGSNPSRFLTGFSGGDEIGFAIIANSTREAVLAGITPTSSVLLGQIQSDDEDGDGAFVVNFEDSDDGDFDDLSITLEVTDEAPPIGIGLQGTSELIDLREFVTGTGGQVVQATVDVESEAAFNNVGGLYVVQDENGTVLDIDGVTLLSPGDDGYAEAVLAQNAPQRQQFSDDTSFNLLGGFIYAAYVLADGDTTQFYSTFTGSDSADGSATHDHLILLGDNRFGFEDVSGLGDADFDDFGFEITMEVI